MGSINNVETCHGLVHRRAVIRYTYDDPTNPQQKGGGLITMDLRRTSEESARSYLMRTYPKLKNIQVTELIFI